MSQPDYIHDIFISYSLTEQNWVRDELLQQLSQAGFTVVADHRDFAIGASWLGYNEHPIWRSRVVVLVLSSRTNGDKRAHFEALLAGLAERTGHAPRALALLLEPCELSERLALLKPINLTNPALRSRQMRRLLRALDDKRLVFISYQRGTEPDESLARQLAAHLGRAGHQVFIDQAIAVSMGWAAEMQRQIEASDYLVVLLSAASAQSEMVADEIAFAYQRFQENSGRPRILSVRVNYHDALPYQIGMYLDRLPVAEWRVPADTRRLVVQLSDAIGHGEMLPSYIPAADEVVEEAQPIRPPAAYADPHFIESLDAPGGTMRLHSACYIERGADTKLRRVLDRQRGTTITIRAPRQTGKSSLLIRGMAQMQAQGGQAVFVDLQPIDSIFLQDLDRFLRHFATIIVTRLKFDLRQVDKIWSGPLAAPNKLTDLMEDYVLPQSDTKIVLAIDEAERLLNAAYRDSFFGLMRAWHNSRARNELWDRLDMILVIATEPNMLIQDINQSPFNVGQTIELEDFDADQVAKLNVRYHSPVGERDLPALLALLGGHPYLTSRALYTMLTQRLTWEQLTQVAAAEKGPFADHLRRYVWMLRDQPELRGALEQIMDQGRCDDRLFFRLMQAGLVKGVDGRSCALRCALYEEYLHDKL